MFSSTHELKTAIVNCRSCPLFQGISKGPMAFEGQGTFPIMIVSDSPTGEEYNNGGPLRSSGGQFLFETLKAVGFENPNAFVRTNCVKCHQPKGLQGNQASEALMCGGWLDQEIAMFRPKLVIALGNLGLYRFSQDYDNRTIPRKKELDGIGAKHGEIEWNERYQCWVMFLMSPRSIIHNPRNTDRFMDALHKLKTFINNGFRMPEEILETKYTHFWLDRSLPEDQAIAKFVAEVRPFLQWLKEQPEYSADIETTGFDWYEDDMLCCGFSWRPGRAACVEWHPAIYQDFADVMESPALKIMQNGRFDLKFLTYKYGFNVVNYMFDTMIAAKHCDENGPVGLGELVNRYLGIPSYKEEIWSPEPGPDGKKLRINTHEALRNPTNVESFSTYTCKDADFTLRLKHKLKPILINPFGDEVPPPIERTPWNVFTNISMPLNIVLSKMERKGIDYNREYQSYLETILLEERDKTYAEAKELMWREVFPNPPASIHKLSDYLKQLLASIDSEVTNLFATGVLDKRHDKYLKEYQVEREAFFQKLDAAITSKSKEEMEERVRSAARHWHWVNSSEEEVVDPKTGLLKVKKTRETFGLRSPIASLKTAAKRGGADIRSFEDSLKVIEDANTWLKELYNFEMNLNSSDEMRRYLFDVLKLPVRKKTKRGEASTDKEVIAELAPLHPFVRLVSVGRNIDHDISNYIVAVRNATHPLDLRVHPTYSQTTAVTGRLSCKEPAMHGISRIFRIRNMFVPKKGNLFIEGDLSQAEVRFLAAMANDQNLIDAFLAGGDIHEQNARRIFKTPDGEKPTKEQRSATKRIVFSILYGSAVSSVAESLGVDLAEAQSYFDAFYNAFPDTKKWMDETVEFVKKNGYVQNYYGRIRRLPTIWSSNNQQYSEAIRQCINAPIQGGATGDFVGIAHIKIQAWLDEEFPKGEVYQVHNHHDAIVLEAPIDLAEYVRDKVKAICEHADPSLPVPMKMDIDVVRCWSGSPMTTKDIELYKIAEAENRLPLYHYCEHESDGKKCGNLFMPFSDYNTRCPDHWKAK